MPQFQSVNESKSKGTRAGKISSSHKSSGEALKPSVIEVSVIKTSEVEVKPIHGAVSTVADAPTPSCIPSVSEVVDHFNCFFYGQLMWMVGISVAGALIINALEGHTFTQTWFMAVSCVTGGGLNSLDISKMHLKSQIVLFALMLVGNSTLLGIVPSLIRMYRFRAAAANLIKEEGGQGPAGSSVSAFLAQQTEYRATMLFVKIAFAYWFTTQAVGFLVMGFYGAYWPHPQRLLAKRHVNAWWFSAFATVSAYSNVGYLPLTDNIAMFADDPVYVFAISTLQMLGNVLLAFSFRIITWLVHRTSKEDYTAKYLLENPRKCSMLMFSARVTVQLMAFCALITISQFVVFCAYEVNRDYMQQYPLNTRYMIGWFMAVSTRTGGFSAVTVTYVGPALQVLYGLCMYLPITPVVFILRPHNVGSSSIDGRPGKANALPPKHLKDGKLARQRSDSDDFSLEKDLGDGPPRTMVWQIIESTEKFMSQELPYLGLSLFAIAIADNAVLLDNEGSKWLTVWGVAFELTAAWGTAGLTLSPGATCLASYLSPFSQYVVMFAMLKARQRVPVAIDPVIEFEDSGDLSSEALSGTTTI
jgi:Trk-type K+ transport system membrane component